ncbi:unnamed protein product [Boreogadus saida]
MIAVLFGVLQSANPSLLSSHYEGDHHPLCLDLLKIRVEVPSLTFNKLMFTFFIRKMDNTNTNRQYLSLSAMTYLSYKLSSTMQAKLTSQM